MPANPKGQKVNRIKPGRTKDKAHLQFVASLPCCICGQFGSQAHHLMRADPKRGIGRRAGDEYAIPLCLNHHTGLHLCGGEEFYLRQFGIDGPALAAQLWRDSHE